MGGTQYYGFVAQIVWAMVLVYYGKDSIMATTVSDHYLLWPASGGI